MLKAEPTLVEVTIPEGETINVYVLISFATISRRVRRLMSV